MIKRKEIQFKKNLLQGNYWRKYRSSLGIGILTLIFGVLLFLASAFASVTEPDNPLDLVADSYESDIVTLNCIGENNDKVYINLPVGVSSSQSQTSGDDENQDAPEEQDDPQQEEENEPEEQPEPTEIPSASTTTGNSSQSGSTGTGGGNVANGLQDDTVYFTTSIRDGEIVTNPTYSFTITHKIPSLTVKSLRVLVNDKEVTQFNGKVELTEGTNIIRIIVQYADENGKTLSPMFKDYTVTLDSTSLVITTDLSTKTVNQELLEFTAYSSYLGNPVDLSVTMNGKQINGTNNRFSERLNDGENIFVLTASAGGLSKTLNYIVTYINDGNFEIFSNLQNGTVYNSELTFRAWLRNASDKGRIVAKLNGTSITPDGDSYTVNLKYGENTISLVGIDGSTRCTPVTYQIIYKPQVASADNPNPDPEHAPSVTVNFKNGDEIASSRFTLKVTAKTYNGTRINGDHMTVSLNGTTVAYFANGETVTYILDLREGPNTIVVIPVDDEGYSIYYSYVLNYVPAEGAIGQATISIEAVTLGLGYIIPPTTVDVYDKEPVAYVLDRLLTEYGCTMNYSGSFDSGFYLRRINKTGITDGYKIPDVLQTMLDNDGQLMTYTIEADSLGEMDFYKNSGWMVAVNGEYPSYGFSDIFMMDGDVCNIRFTLAMGKDIGSGEDQYSESFIMKGNN